MREFACKICRANQSIGRITASYMNRIKNDELEFENKIFDAYLKKRVILFEEAMNCMCVIYHR
jgi:hypothetical protein